MQYIVYLTTNLITKKIYYGVHGTHNMNDGYLGSGKIIKKAIKKYGRENFSRQIIAVFDTKEAAFKLEASIVDDKFLQRLDVYNCYKGGGGCRSFSLSEKEACKVAGKKGSLEAWKILRQKYANSSYKLAHARKVSVGQKLRYQRLRESGIVIKRSAEAKRKQSQTMSIIGRGQGNSCFGTRWMFNPILQQNKRIKLDSIDTYLKNGWIFGVSRCADVPQRKARN